MASLVRILRTREEIEEARRRAEQREREIRDQRRPPESEYAQKK